jgi:hypothetical protein
MWLIKGGARYVVRATGVWRHGHGSGTKADAVCEQTKHGWHPSTGRVGTASVYGDQFNSLGQTWVPTHDNGRGCNIVNHTYKLALAAPHTSTVVGQLMDATRHDDSGSVTLTITRH